MPLPRGLPVVDHHCHLSLAGDGVLAARRFRHAGGTHLFLATQNYGPTVPRQLEDYAHQFETTFALADRVRREVGIEVFAVVAPYPIDLVTASAQLGLPRALDLHRAATDLAGRAVQEGKAVAIGEVGRAHFPVGPEASAAIEAAFTYALTVAREVGCPVVVHSADLDAGGYAELSARAHDARLPAERVVKHYARARVAPEDRAGVVPSYLGRKDLIDQVLADPSPWFLETDYLDDPARPGAVLDLATVPRRARWIADRGTAAAERLFVPFVESVEKVYGLRLDATPRSGA